MEAVKLISLFILIYSSVNYSVQTEPVDGEIVKKSLSNAVIGYEKSENELEKDSHKKINSFSVQMSQYSNYQEKEINLTRPSILLFDSIESFVEWNKKLKFQPNARVRFPHLIYIDGATFSDIDALEWGFDGDNTNILLREGKSIKLVTGYMFGPSRCARNQFSVINRFKSSTLKWEGSTFYPDKYQNFYGCPLRAARYEACKSENYYYQILASALNFKLDYFDYDHSNNSNHFEAVKDPRNDLFCGEIMLLESAGKANLQVAGTRYYSDEVKIIAPYGELLTPLEKMLMPFYFEVWVAILVTLLLSLLVIQIINRCTQEVQNAFFDGNNEPTLSLAELFLCGAQRHRPRRSPARFILMMMVIWCLIIRTCHQSELFKYLQSDARKPGVKSVADIIDQNFTVYGGFSTRLLDQYTQDRGLPSVQTREHEEYDFDIVAEPDNKAVMLTTVDLLTFQVNKKLRIGVPSFVLLDEVIWSIHIEFVYKRGLAFKKNFDRKTTQLLESGIIARYIQDGINRDKMKIKHTPEIIGPQVLTMEHLDIGFTVWLIPLTLSVIVFVFEVSKRPCRELREHIRGAIVARSVVIGYIDHKKIKALAIRGARQPRGKPKQPKNFKPPRRLKHKIIIVKSSENQK